MVATESFMMDTVRDRWGGWVRERWWVSEEHFDESTRRAGLA
jgi:hypothetical protein